ncbi:MAG: nucleotidyltransferase substrate binding protein [Lachnospiraceae bacterium]|nr:nucleotidyltransferase substrate binding protein [Lachnospiraceae bacterium]
MEKSYTKRLNAFEKSLETLSGAKNEDKNNLFVLSGTIMIFNLTFDLAWKLIKEILKEDYGISDFPSGSPKETLKKAKSVNLINDDIWLEMLDDRNELTHDYDYDSALEKYNKIISDYIPLLQNFRENIPKK